ncbi:MAG TPA: helix-turn-helix domain-containing protein [Candidatus Micrarchaeia archaeon]|nr:helix-turn-helix domain-containing protein [Candidatus Micrarchaeia archaeon]
MAPRVGRPPAGRPVGAAASTVGDRMEFAEYLRARCQDRGLSLHRLAVLCDLNQIYFYQSVSKNRSNPPPWVLRRAAPHLGVSYVELMIAAGHLRDDDLVAHRRARGRGRAPVGPDVAASR